MATVDAEVDGKSIGGVCLSEGRDEAVVQSWVESFDRANNGDMWCFFFSLIRRAGIARRIVSPSEQLLVRHCWLLTDVFVRAIECSQDWTRESPSCPIRGR